MRPDYQDRAPTAFAKQMHAFITAGRGHCDYKRQSGLPDEQNVVPLHQKMVAG
jgi:hypothetical protein